MIGLSNSLFDNDAKGNKEYVRQVWEGLGYQLKSTFGNRWRRNLWVQKAWKEANDDRHPIRGGLECLWFDEVVRKYKYPKPHTLFFKKFS